MRAALVSFLVAILVIGTVAVVVGFKIFDTADKQNTEQAIQETIHESEPMFVAEGFTIVSGNTQDDVVKNNLPRFTEELQKAQEQNFEARAWLNIPNTNISGPVLLNVSHKDSSGELDADYYLERSIDNKYAGAGNTNAVIYADVRNKLGSWDELSRNTVIYGHNRTNVESSGALRVADPNDKQFAQLPSFADLDFAKDTTYFTLDLGSEQVVCAVFAAMYVDTYNSDNRDGFYYINTDPTDEEFSYIVSEARARSEHLYKVPVGVNDKIVTLTTCTLKYGSDHNQRFVVMGRVLRPEDDITDFGEPVKNLYPKRPDIN